MTHQTLVAWLKDAYAMEEGEIPALESFAREARDQPDLRQKVEEHLEKTRRHAEKIRECIQRLGEDASSIKAVRWQTGAFRGECPNRPRDDVIKDVLAGIATEQFEIASYKALLVAAQAADDFQTLRVCEEILDDEEDMARFLEDHLPPAVQEFVSGDPG